MAQYDYRIGAGYNLPLGSLTNIETITPASATAFYAPSGLGTYDPGELTVRGDGSVLARGQASCEWRWQSISRLQIRYLQNTYCNGAMWGTVTIYTPLDNMTGTEVLYQRCNAVMNLPKLPDAGRDFTRYTNYNVRFTRVGTL